MDYKAQLQLRGERPNMVLLEDPTFTPKPQPNRGRIWLYDATELLHEIIHVTLFCA